MNRSIDAGTPIASAARRDAWLAFALVFGLMVFDYVDRQVVVSMFPFLRHEWTLSDARLGLLASIVPITVAVATVPLSFLADRWGRVNSMALMALVWSGATIACAFARDYADLLAARAVVGLGEAAYGTAGAALLATLFPARMRSTILGAFASAGLVGSVLGVAVGGIVSQRYGWQAAFGLVGIPGIVLAIAFKAMVRDYPNVPLPRRVADGGAGAARTIVAALWKPRSLPLTCAGAGLQLLVVSATYSWLPSYFNRFQGHSPEVAAIHASIVVLVSGAGGVAWSVVADRLARRRARARLYVPAVSAFVCAGVMSFAFGVLEPGAAQYALLVAAAVSMTAAIGPSGAVVMDVAHPAMRATAASVLSLTQNLLGLAVGPVLTGYLSDLRGLQFAMAAVPAIGVPAACAFIAAARTYPADKARARAAGDSA